MARLFIPLVFGLILFVVWLFAVLDVISTDEMLMRNLPKLVWLFIVVLFPTVGAIAWFALGRPIGRDSPPAPAGPAPAGHGSSSEASGQDDRARADLKIATTGRPAPIRAARAGSRAGLTPLVARPQIPTSTVTVEFRGSAGTRAG